MTFNLTLNPDQTATLLKLDAQLRGELEQYAFPTFPTVDIFRSELTKALDGQPGFFDMWEKAAATSQELCLVCPDTATRNLPWHLALLDGNRLFTMTKSAAAPDAHAPTNRLPLKILVMVAAPEGAVALDHESEELRLLRAIEPMMAKGLAQVHFTDDGSLESLERALLQNHYHVLHFSGHGIYKDSVGYLLTEDEASGQPKKVNARDFNALLARMAERGKRPELVLLSACQSAQGEKAGDLQGVADTLLAGGVPAVIAMAASILDPCATEFTTVLYEQLAKDKETLLPLPVAFREAVFALKKYELENPRIQNLRQGREAGQWLIPQLLVSKNVRGLADLSKTHQVLDFRDARFVAGEEMLNLRGADRKKYNYVFLGRRKERRQALAHLRDPDRPFVLLRGQGGVGKTSLAEHLAVRFLAADPKYKVFMHSEKAPPLQALLDRVKDFLVSEKGDLDVMLEVEKYPEQLNKFIFLLSRAEKLGLKPLFVFDNIESFQKVENGVWLWNRESHDDLFEGINLLFKIKRYPLIFTGRYPIAEFPDLPVCDLNAVGFNEFRKKCWQLPFGEKLSARLEKSDATPATKTPPPLEGAGGLPTFEQICQLLHRCFGGNYRALEFFDELFAEKPDDIFATLGKLENLEANIRDTRDERSVLARMSENLVFSELLALLSPAEREALALLARFRIPVLPMALGMQRGNRDLSPQLDRLADLTLAERSLPPTPSGGGDAHRFFVMPIVQDLLAEANFPPHGGTEGGLGGLLFLEKTAGDYHNYVVENDLSTDALTDLDQAFEWYCAAGAAEEVNDVGGRLCNFYHEVQQFRLSLAYGLRTEEVAGEKTDWKIWNNLGQIFKTFGHLDAALNYWEKSLAHTRKEGHKQGEGATLNNISQIYKARGDYDTALKHLQQSLKISQEIGDRAGEGVTLNNIGQIYSARGDYDTALKYLQQSLKIQQEIGDRAGEGATLSNISLIYSARGDYDTALKHLQQSLKICQEIGDRAGEGATLNNIGQIYSARGDYDTALKHLQQSLKICQEIGDREGEGATLSNISLIYSARGDYDTALKHLQQSLKIRQEIGDREGEGATLNNISQIYSARGDYDTALKHLQQSLKISQEIGDRAGEGVMLNNIGQIYSARGDYDTALKYLQQSLKIQQEIGDRAGEGTTLSNISQIYSARGDYDTALKYLQQSLKIQQEIGDISGMATTMTNMGAMLFEQNRLEEAVPLLMQAYGIFQQIGSPNVRAPEGYLGAIIEKIGQARFEEIMKGLGGG